MCNAPSHTTCSDETDADGFWEIFEPTDHGMIACSFRTVRKQLAKIYFLDREPGDEVIDHFDVSLRDLNPGVGSQNASAPVACHPK